MNTSVYILGIESSCDDTSIAVIKDGLVLSNLLTSQWIHKKYGGVVPEAASRQHVESIIPLAIDSLHEAGIKKQELTAIAVTRGPGLMGSLLVGISFAKALSLSLSIPLIEINHLQAHMHSLFIDETPEFPMICLTVSGGHTQLILLRSMTDFVVLGQTIDDAAGEAFDKTGKLLGLPYPAGPEMDKIAKNGIAKFKFPIAQVSTFDFSFSGLKTAVLYFLRDSIKNNPNFIQENLSDLCASIQQNLVETLVNKVKVAASTYKVKAIGMAGGVSANSKLRESMTHLSQENSWKILIPRINYCTDNAAMIGVLGYEKYKNKNFSEDNFTPLARYPLT